jgi:hypothetical protein
MIYIRLFHGRTDPTQDMDDWGTDGPILGPYTYIHITYTCLIRLGTPDANDHELHLPEDLIYYDCIYYGDWTIFDDSCLHEGKYALTPFEQPKAVLAK